MRDGGACHGPRSGDGLFPECMARGKSRRPILDSHIERHLSDHEESRPESQKHFLVRNCKGCHDTTWDPGLDPVFDLILNLMAGTLLAACGQGLHDMRRVG